MIKFPEQTRRSLLFSLMCAAAMPVAGCSAAQTLTTPLRRSGPAGPAEVVGPHPNWSGAANSGAGAPSDGVRVGAKAIGAFMLPSFQRAAAGDMFSVRVKADAFGGLTGVRFSGDCATTTVGEPALVKVARSDDGAYRPELVYEIQLRVSDFLAKSPKNNVVWIYAEVLAANSAVATRRLGPLVVYMEPTLYDWVGEFTIDGRATATAPGGTFAGLGAGRDAMCAAIMAGAKAAALYCGQTGTYEAVNRIGDYATPAGGYAEFRCRSGVTCTIGRTAIPDLTNSGAWGWKTGLNGARWCKGIRIDNAYLGSFKSFNGPNRPDWYDGCRWTDSLGRDRLWAGQPHPGRGHEGLNTTFLACYFTDCYAEEGGSPFIGALLAIGTLTKRTFGDVYTGSAVVHGSYDLDSTSDWFRSTPDALRITYSGPSSVATCGKIGSNGGFGANSAMTLHDDSGDLVITFVQFQNEANPAVNKCFSWADVAACINARPGWSCVNVDQTGRQARFNFNNASGSTNAWTPQNCRGVTFVIKSLCDIHGDWYQTGQPGNVIIANCVTRGAANDYSGSLFIDGEQDMLIENNILHASNSNGLNISTSQHLLVRNNSLAYTGYVAQARWSDSYSEVARNILSGIGQSGASWPSNPYIKDNYAGTGSFGSGAHTATNFKGGTFVGQFVSEAGGDFRPLAGGAVATNLRAYSGPSYDIFGNPREALDAIGPVSLTHAAGALWPII